MTDHPANDQFHASSFMQGHNAEYLEQMYARYANDPGAVDEAWQAFFKAMGDEDDNVRAEAAGPSWARSDWPPMPGDDLTQALTGEWAAPAEVKGAGEKIKAKAEAKGVELSDEMVKRAVLDSIRALMIIRAYRIRGHLVADLDPLGMRDKVPHPELDPKSYGFTEADMDRPIFIDNVLGLEIASMRQIMEIVTRTYCGTFALQYMHISDPEQSSWLKERIEGLGKEIAFTREGRKAILNKMVEAEGFEKFLHVKYMGTKRFGLDGGESLIPAMEQVIKRGGALGVKEIVIGMPHRGRLSVLANVMQKPYRAIFNEFQGGSFKPEDVDGSGDVKYHLGASSDREFDDNTVHLSLTANPSHLEAVNPVVLGKVRAKQDQWGDTERTQVMPILLHGDAAFAGQGVVAECFALSGLRGHRAGGTMHIVVNNQIGFTTAPHFSRSSPYPTDNALVVEAPIFHVNGDDPEAVVHAAKVATEFRQKFHKDVVIDIFCYRRFGHNEGDEPMFTNPVMYKRIKKQKTTLTLYTDRLVKDGLIPEGEIEDMKAAFQAKMNEEFEAGKEYRPNKADWLDGKWSHLDKMKQKKYQRGKTAIKPETLAEIGKGLTATPEGTPLHKTVERLLEAKKAMFESGTGFDWATAEAIAFGSLLTEGYPVRLSGQDSARGTFSQRHSALINQDNEERYYPLNHIREGQAQYEVIDSMLSEYAVLGFEYGYSLAEPNALTLWEAQFGDFANGAQIMFDQFISSGESKWLRMSGLTVLLPHGFEGQGPEHSSARLERFLQMCGQDNWIVANCTTPANYFHILRRQIHRDFRKPLILMTPKSLLRHKLAISKTEEFTTGSSFHRVLWDDAEHGNSDTQLVADDKIKRVVMCSGKVYYDLLEERDARGIDDIYLLRFEQFYPFPAQSAVKELERFKDAEMIWCQEEPKNQGAWTFIEPNIEWVLGRIKAKHLRPEYVGRATSASPATGLASQHKAQQAALVDEALTIKGSK
ncbi:2-oxoglutarate dehydrogenase E1 component [Pseudosulfitobacter pseudonitzschiae]|uniref:2-oxoglutarate dehydrogenase E1 component n=1 Tax=Pseudosulfitobacter pseudonitzschiae TaxID=1402135 RepID=UPI001AF86A3F|nr:2-oxoglutarate dehydrogenase E1 component [Pseudosulfitobacter pseudonitzschiae]MBM1814962.1 2-oxoglutarate dehydrogenase E1 component [Pseudosulfitobacter pseudonitzschiae]MBM1831953.1 2-oxoglutarate dehydrogenase E1 component [Pseudosulfitobacter pseudonitzschiae]MBM1836821.1 2-oxoglutarate dehydrogenase E1 component [Pseudosulfitobacter pseudonitzschiae]MBM1841667.1 2-oxoglutarate dehydrogenase E1 component [Pseudosulfitobacter pseudonitzschiae]MBM1846535.1 2-oxoglutarate dehydrogenase E